MITNRYVAHFAPESKKLRPPTRAGAPFTTLRKRLFADTLREPRSTRNRSSSLVPLSLDKNPSFSGAEYVEKALR